MTEISRDEIVESAERRIALSGARLTERERDFLVKASWQERRKAEGHRPETTTNTQRKAKHDLIKRLRQGLKDLTITGIPLTWGEQAWWKKADLRKAIDKEALLEVVRIAVRYFGRDYADPLLTVLKDAYSIGREEIVVQRRI